MSYRQVKPADSQYHHRAITPCLHICICNMCYNSALPMPSQRPPQALRIDYRRNPSFLPETLTLHHSQSKLPFLSCTESGPLPSSFRSYVPLTSAETWLCELVLAAWCTPFAVSAWFNQSLQSLPLTIGIAVTDFLGSGPRVGACFAAEVLTEVAKQRSADN